MRWLRLTCLTLISLARNDSVSYGLSTIMPMIVRADPASMMPLVGLKALIPTTSRQTCPFSCRCNFTSGSLTMTKALSLFSSLSRIVQVGGVGTKYVICGAGDSGRPGLSP